jgi:heptaprenyl diphosphate synthase
MALLTAVALILFTVEAQIPPPVPIPGVKLGLANIITVYAMFALGAADALGILLARVLLGSMFSGAMMTLFYSLSGGLLCWLLMLSLRRVLTKQQIWVCGVLGAVAHNVGQTLAAIAVFQTLAVAAYFPLLVLSGIIAGLFTGLCAQFVVHHAHLMDL